MQGVQNDVSDSCLGTIGTNNMQALRKRDSRQSYKKLAGAATAADLPLRVPLRKDLQNRAARRGFSIYVQEMRAATVIDLGAHVEGNRDTALHRRGASKISS